MMKSLTETKIAKGIVMKATNKALIVCLASIGLFGLASPSQAQYKPTGDDGITASPKVRQTLNEIKTRRQAEALKPGDAVAMVCAKCKSVMVHNVTTEKGHIKIMTVGEKHTCPGCNSTITVVGTGKGKHDEVRHTCAKCGDDSVFCCATKPGSGPTKGMEKK
jgi:hypothetical protein